MQCCVHGCSNSKVSKSSKVTFHKFPPSGHLRDEWVEAIKKKQGLLPNQLSVCSEHFSHDQFLKTSTHQKILRKNAVPNRFNLASSSRALHAKPARSISPHQEPDDAYVDWDTLELPSCSHYSLYKKKRYLNASLSTPEKSKEGVNADKSHSIKIREVQKKAQQPSSSQSTKVVAFTYTSFKDSFIPEEIDITSDGESDTESSQKKASKEFLDAFFRRNLDYTSKRNDEFRKKILTLEDNNHAIAQKIHALHANLKEIMAVLGRET